MSMREWYKGRSILVTGGSGFMGKVLIEKLLRCCPGIVTVYFICRPKRGNNVQTRVSEMFKLPLFECLRRENPDVFKKVVAVEGDITQDGLGIGIDAKNEIKKSVSIVFNFAASLKLEAGLKESVEHNTRGSQRVLEFAKELPKLAVFLHLSTAFCHCEEEVLEERLYQPPADPQDILDAMKWMDADTADLITPKLLGVHPNCYTFTKRLTEALMAKYGKQMPIVVCRPAIVSPSLKDPIPGWVDNLNGPVGVFIAAGKGVLRTMLCGPNNTAEVIPVDVCINGILIATWKRGITKPNDVPVYNMTGSKKITAQWGPLVEKGRSLLKEYPLDPGLWYPGGTIRTNPYTHALALFFFQIIPAYFIDFIMLIAQQKRFMVRVQNRILLGLKLLQYFTMRNWHFEADNFMNLSNLLDEKEREIFFTSNVDVDLDTYLKNFILGSKIYCLKEPIETMPRARKYMKMMYVLDVTCTCIIYFALAYYLAPLIFRLKDFVNRSLHYTPVSAN
ncbi:putative fatty acyl-CoA reductase CG5065 [Cimex lectularius]|uniref:Fatty acyl-CoA reductase n=1 Tax=Cimex lectularius TaxID=79782 RepID=A0A8I6RCS4_CIMLE|nr:putative fatty acyl-CoA reductase CG5065 [Cimex lectularius]